MLKVTATKTMAKSNDKVGDIILNGLFSGAITQTYQIVHIETDEDGFRTATLIPVERISYQFEVNGEVFYLHYYKPQGEEV